VPAGRHRRDDRRRQMFIQLVWRYHQTRSGLPNLAA
jgi:hypothetical protein